jgi:hypothetical protein
MDLIFYLFVAGSWMTTTKSNLVWNSLQGAHGFAIFCSAVITVLKVRPAPRRSRCSTSSIPSANRWN